MTADPEERRAPDRPAEERAGQASAAESEHEALSQVSAILQSGSALANDLMELLATESQLAGRSLGFMLMLGVMMGLLLISVWLFLGAALGIWMVDTGFLSPVMAMLLVAAINAALTLGVWLLFVRLSRNLTFREFFGALRSLSKPVPEPGGNRNMNNDGNQERQSS